MSEQLLESTSILEWLKITSFDIHKEFDRIANEIFNHHLIRVNDNHYRLLEIEFYYKSEIHPDIYTHGHPMQTKLGQWYFHGSGVDLTFGEENIHGGILLRSIEKIQPRPTDKKQQYIFGPLNVQMELLNNFHPVFSKEANVFQLVPASNQIDKVPADKIIQSTRIGLSDKKTGGTDYHQKHYRYLIHPHLGHREKTNIAKALMKKYGSDKAALDTIKNLLGSEFLKDERVRLNLNN